ncbi:unnamed protein product, partial [Cyprideis torosa]
MTYTKETAMTAYGSELTIDIMASLRDVFGGRSGSYEKVLREAKESAMQEMIAIAQQKGADAIVGIDLDYETLGAGQ